MSAGAVVLDSTRIGDLADDAFSDPQRGHGLTWKTLVSGSKTATDTLTSGIATCAPGNSSLCEHSHKQAELYHIIEGTGVVKVNGVDHAVKNGSVIYIPGDVKHGIRNSSNTAPLTWLYVFAANDFEEIQYQFPHERNPLGEVLGDIA